VGFLVLQCHPSAVKFEPLLGFTIVWSIHLDELSKPDVDIEQLLPWQFAKR